MRRFNNVFKTLFIFAFVASLVFAAGCSTSKVQSKESGNKLVMDPAIKQGTLENGMTYFIRENGEPKNRIQLRLAVKAGSCMEDDDQKGIAHFVEHLCFNGTEHFEKSAIVDYFESIGMQFGPEVNAYTTFEQTVYMLELPADNPEILKTSLMVLHDWASAVTFNPEEIEKERGVIVEEWRIRTQGVQGRISDKEVSLLYKDSKYADRVPIGDMDIIKTISPERIIDFYKKWYRPELMSVVAVGDIKAGVLENAIKEIMGTIPASEKKIKNPEFKIPLQTQKKIEIIRDKELQIVEGYIFQQSKNTSPVTTVEELREEMALGLAATIFNQRCQEITNAPDASWLGAGMSSFSLTNNNPIYYMQFFPKSGMFTDAFKALLDEYERFLTHGVTESELERLKLAYLQNIKQSYANKETHASANYADNIVKHFLTGRIFISEDDNLKIATEIVNQITAEEILEVTKKEMAGRGTIMMLLVPESMEVPAEKEILNIWKNYESEAAKEAYVDDTGDNELMKKPEVKAKVSEKKAIKELGSTQYTFENGVKVITKKTNFKKDTIALYAGSKGGLFQLKEEEVPSAKVAVEYATLSGFGGKTFNQIQKISTPLNLEVSISITNTQERINALASRNNLEQNLQMINLIFSQPQFTDEAWATMISQYKQVAENYGARPIQVFSDKVNEMLFGKTFFHSPVNKEFVANMNQKTAERIYRERFANPADFTFVFVGDFNEKELIDLCAYYLGTLETNNKFDETKYVYFPFPEKSKTETVRKGIDENGDVFICFGGQLPVLPETDGIEIGFKESTIIRQLGSLLDIRLREVIREDKGGSYGVSCGGYIDGWPERFYEVYVEFGCEPAREEELQAVVIDTIKDIQKGNISDELVTKLKESYVRNVETSLRDNGWWLNRISAEVLFTYEPLWYTKDSKKAAEWITKEALIEAANKYLDTNRVVTGYWKPEGK